MICSLQQTSSSLLQFLSAYLPSLFISLFISKVIYFIGRIISIPVNDPLNRSSASDFPFADVRPSAFAFARSYASRLSSTYPKLLIVPSVARLSLLPYFHRAAFAALFAPLIDDAIFPTLTFALAVLSSAPIPSLPIYISRQG